MSSDRKISREDPGLATVAGSPTSARPMTARSVIASTLLGVDPPRLPALLLARSGELFGISEGSTRVALSRMVAAGELEPDDGGYRLAGHLLERQERQRTSRAPVRRAWDGAWTMAVVGDARRSAADRAALRSAMRLLHLAEDREAVWLRPDNLDEDRDPASAAVVAAQCRRFRSTPVDESSPDLAARLWDLDGWSATARTLQAEMADLVGPFEAGDTSPLPRGFVLSAAVLRHLVADPLLPDELLGGDWPGSALRRDYDRYDRAFKSVWRDWFRAQPAG
jgi:phenylacetic acid degradation operon negative regulatory protein